MKADFHKLTVGLSQLRFLMYNYAANAPSAVSYT